MMVACDAEDPGIPIITEGKVSDVGMTATIPMSKAKALWGSMP